MIPATATVASPALGALFDEVPLSATVTSKAWLYFGLYMLAGLMAAAICAYIAISRGSAALPWFAAGMVLNVIALAVLLTRPRANTHRLPEGIPPGLRKVPATYAPVACSGCRATNHPSATFCSGCGGPLQPSVTGDTTRL